MIRTKPLLIFFGLFLILSSPASKAAVSAFTELPNLTAYLECRATTCTSAQLEQNAKSDAVSRGPGTYQYLLGNVATGVLMLVQVHYIHEKLCDYGCNTYFTRVTLSQQSPPSDYASQFSSYATYAGEGPIVVHVDPTKVGGFEDDDAWEFDTSGYLRALPEFQSVFIAQQPIEVEVIFADGTSAIFVSVPAMYNQDPGLAFTYVIGSARDAKGNPIPDTGLIGSTLSLGGAGQFAGWGAANWNGGFLILPNVPVYYRGGGTVIVGPVCDNQGNCTSTL